MGKRRFRGKRNKNDNRMKIKVYGRYRGLVDWITGYEMTDYKNAQTIVMPGGADWNPFWYGDMIGKKTYFTNSTDIEQMEQILKALKDRKLILGICRGLQGVHIAAGGKLIQDVTNHGSCSHPIIDEYTDKTVTVNSFHHQMVDLLSLKPHDYTLIASSLHRRSDSYLDGLDQEKMFGDLEYRFLSEFKEPEIVYYPHINALGFQYHPESMSKDNPALEYTNSIIQDIMININDIAYPNEVKTTQLILSLESRLDAMKYHVDKSNKKPVKSVFNLRTTHLPETNLLTSTANSSKEEDCCSTTSTRNEKNWSDSVKKL